MKQGSRWRGGARGKRRPRAIGAVCLSLASQFFACHPPMVEGDDDGTAMDDTTPSADDDATAPTDDDTTLDPGDDTTPPPDDDTSVTDDDDSAGSSDEDGDGYTVEDGDCDDADPLIHPTAPETCDDLDQNCDGLVDEDAADASWWYRDADGDGYGDAASASWACAAPPGWVGDSSDCDDAASAVHPGASEVCNGVDDDCDGAEDDGAVDAELWYPDADEDAYGDTSGAATTCSAPEGSIEVGGDCDDGNGAVHPGADEVCANGVDDNCDGLSNGCGPEPGKISVWTADLGFVGTVAGIVRTATGDLNGDGYVDLALTDHDDYGWTVRDGSVAVHFGPFEMAGWAWYVSEGDCIVDVDVDATGDGDTWQYAAVGDVTGDGRDDLVTGIRQAPGGGRVYVFDDCPEGAAIGAEAAVATISGDVDGEYYGIGYCVSAGSDFNGDGIADLQVGGSGGGLGRNSASIFYGPVNGASVVSHPDAQVLSSEDAYYIGYTCSDVGDVNGDGVDDWAVGATHPGSGAVYVMFGPLAGDMGLGSEGATIHGASDDAEFGDNIAIAGDVDGDGTDDFWAVARSQVTAGGGWGTVYLIRGPMEAGSWEVDDLASAQVDAVPGDWIGSANPTHIQGGFDVNGDGASDLLVSDASEDDGYTDSGAAWLMYGPFSGATDLSTAHTKFLGPSPGGALSTGFFVSPADLNGDGYDDLAMASPYLNIDAGFDGMIFIEAGGAM